MLPSLGDHPWATIPRLPSRYYRSHPTVPVLPSSHYHPIFTAHNIGTMLPSSMLLKYTNNKHENVIIPQQKIITKQCMCFFLSRIMILPLFFTWYVLISCPCAVLTSSDCSRDMWSVHNNLCDAESSFSSLDKNKRVIPVHDSQEIPKICGLKQKVKEFEHLSANNY